MIVAYCGPCLPDKILLGYAEKARDLLTPHGTHPWQEKNRFFALSYKEWQAVYVEGDDVQTKANIVAMFGDKFE